MTNKEAIEILESIKERTYGEVMALRIAEEAIKENEKLKQELKEVKQELSTFKALC